MTQLSDVFRPHAFQPTEAHIDLYHVYDNLSQTPYQRGIGIECGDPDEYVMNAWHVITPNTMSQHLDWYNRQPTQFISLFADRNAAAQEAQRRRNQAFVPGGGQRIPNSVRTAHIRLSRGTNVWFFSRAEMLAMMATFGPQARQNISLRHIPVSGSFGAACRQRMSSIEPYFENDRKDEEFF